MAKVSLRNKFKKRNEQILTETYEKREERTSSFSGKSIFNDEKMSEFGVTLFKPHKKDNYFEILPLDFEGNNPYFFECAIHNNVGLNNDNFICMKRISESENCFRCEYQQSQYRIGKKDKDTLKKYYPSDRIMYLIWDRTAELANEEKPTYTISIFNSSKSMDHANIQNLVRDKKKKRIVDISDVSEDGEGKTVYFKSSMKETKEGKFPQRESYELLDRDEAIPDEILEQLEGILQAAKKTGEHPIGMFLHYPDYDEVKEAMQTEIEIDEAVSSKSTKKKDKKKQDDDDDDEEDNKSKKKKGKKVNLEELAEELEDMSRKEIIKWAKSKDLEDQIDDDFSKEELIEAIIDYYQNQ